MLSFEWNKQKNLTNIAKHGVSFEEAETVFYDEYAWLNYDVLHSYDEERFKLFGESYFGNVLMVVHCIRKEDVIRIISARKATAKEAKEYMRRRTNG